MKKNFAKILSAALTLCVILGALLGVSAFAAGSIDDAINSEGVIDFEGAPVGEITASGSKIKLGGTPTYVNHSIVEDEVNGKVYQWNKTKGGYGANDSIQFDFSGGSSVNTFVASFKMKITKGNNEPLRFNVRAGDTNGFRIAFQRDGSHLYVASTEFTDYVDDVNGWFEVKIVYYEGDTEPTAPNKDMTEGIKVSVFINENHIKDFTTFGQNTINRTYRVEALNNFTISSTINASMVALFDDIKIEKKNVVTPEIESVNLAYSDQLFLYYAVPKATVPSDVAPKLVGEANGNSFVITKYSEETVNGKDCYIFKSVGVPAKELNTKQTVKVVAGDAMSEELTYSVEQYLYEMLYDEGYIAETEAGVAGIGEDDGKDLDRRNLYLKLLEYGYYAQKLLVTSPADVIADVPYVSINGTTADFSGEAAVGTSYTLTSADAAVTQFVVVTSDAFGETITTKTVAAGTDIVTEGFTLVYPVK